MAPQSEITRCPVHVHFRGILLLGLTGPLLQLQAQCGGRQVGLGVWAGRAPFPQVLVCSEAVADPCGVHSLLPLPALLLH